MDKKESKKMNISLVTDIVALDLKGGGAGVWFKTHDSYLLSEITDLSRFQL